jgi:predicted Rossmann fold nucleotide-binding protein DprA/Smf involved in DNA uptake
LPGATAQAIVSRGAFSRAEKELGQLREMRVQLRHWGESEYPTRLLEIYDPPPML